jgi:hypothetical protein
MSEICSTVRRADLASFLAATAVLSLLAGPVSAQVPTEPVLPLVFLDTTYTPPPGQTIAVAVDGDFQEALDAARPGDVIELQAGATFTGPFILPNKQGSGWIYIQSSALTSLPPPGTRVSPAQANLMPRIQSGNIFYPAIVTAAGAHHYRFVGIEITTDFAETSATISNLVALEAFNGQTEPDDAPTDIVFDRCYIHGTPTGNVRRGISMQSARTAVIDSYLADFHEVSADSQAIAAWNGPGPFKIVNNYLEGAGENVMFGGADPSIANLVPADIEVRQNYFFKPLSWRVGDPSYAGIRWQVKNLFELKNARRVLIEGNIFEHSWGQAQRGFGIVFTVRDQNGMAPWSTVEDVTFRLNIVRRAGGGINVSGTDDAFGSQETARVLIQNNLLADIGPQWGGAGRVFQLLNGLGPTASPVPPFSSFAILGLTIDHNTARTDGQGPLGIGDSRAPINQLEGFIYRNNLTERGFFGVVGTDEGEGTQSLAAYCTPGYVFVRNVIIGAPAASYPIDNFFPATDADVGFVDDLNGNYALSALSPYRNAGTDGRDIGADFGALAALTAGVQPGTPNLPAPPVISGVSAALISASSATIMWTTSTAGDSQMDYGPTPAYGASTPRDPTLVVYHLQTLGGLTANTSYQYRVRTRDAAGNLATSGNFTFTTLPRPPPGGQAPYMGSPFPVPGLIEAEDFDSGGEGVAYRDLTPGNQGGQYRLDTDVDIISPFPGVNVISDFQTGEWLTYTINVTQSGIYRIEALVSSMDATSRWHADIDGVNVTGAVPVPNTGSLGTFQWVGASGANLTAGQHVLRLVADQQSFNLDAIRMTLSFTDDALVARGTVVKAAHITEMRAAINRVRVARGLSTFAWTDPTLTPAATVVKLVHMTELRTALNQAYQVAGSSPPSYTDPTVGPGGIIIEATHLNELRSAVRALE